MARIAIAPPFNAHTFGPLGKTYDRLTEDGAVPIINFLLGSHYNNSINGELTATSTGSIIEDSLYSSAGELRISGKSSDGTVISKTGSFTTFTYLFPGVKLAGHLKLSNPTVAPPDYMKARYTIEDLSTVNKIHIELKSGLTQATLYVYKEIASVETLVVSQPISIGEDEVYFELDWQEAGITKFYYMEPTGTSKIRILNSNIDVDVGECKISCSLTSTVNAVCTVYSDYLWIAYPNIFVTYDVPLADRLYGKVYVFDTNNSDTEADWTEAFSPDHAFIGERIIDNGIIRVKITSAPSMIVYGYNGSSWVETSTINPISNTNIAATVLHNFVFERFNYSQCKFKIQYGIVEHIVDLRRGMPYVTIMSNSKYFKVSTSKARFALSVDDPDTKLQDFNQKFSDEANRGNPLNLATPVTTFTFTDNDNATTGIDWINDNWYCWYNIANSDTAGWIGVTKDPVALAVKATSSSALDNMSWTFDTNPTLVGVGVITGSTNVTISGVPRILAVSSPDQYVKWRANECLFTGNQKIFLKKKR